MGHKQDLKEKLERAFPGQGEEKYAKLSQCASSSFETIDSDWEVKEYDGGTGYVYRELAEFLANCMDYMTTASEASEEALSPALMIRALELLRDDLPANDPDRAKVNTTLGQLYTSAVENQPARSETMASAR